MSKTRFSDTLYKSLTALLGGSALLFILAVVGILLIYSYPSVVVNGVRFFTTKIWNPSLNGGVLTVNGFKITSGATYGIVVFVAGTLVSSGLAVLIGVPAGLAISVFLTQIAPRKIATPVSFLVELLAGIPSVIFGFWGIIVLGPFLRYGIEPVLSKYLYFVPGFSPPVYSSGLLASGIILAIMIVPIIAAISRDVMSQTPLELKEGARAMGLTDWEITRKVVLPFAKTGIVGAVTLGLGRALGETMAVAMVSGSALNYLPNTVYSSINTMAAFMALQMDSAFTDPSGMFVHALMELAVTLLLITMVVNIVARILVKQGFIGSAETAVRV
jgi:phosphate transport system permease protein